MTDPASGHDSATSSSPSGGFSPKRLFVSYSHKDTKHHDDLCKHLKQLQRDGVIELWTDRMIDGGDRWKKRDRREF